MNVWVQTLSVIDRYISPAPQWSKTSREILLPYTLVRVEWLMFEMKETIANYKLQKNYVLICVVCYPDTTTLMRNTTIEKTKPDIAPVHILCPTLMWVREAVISFFSKPTALGWSVTPLKFSSNHSFLTITDSTMTTTPLTNEKYHKNIKARVM